MGKKGNGIYEVVVGLEVHARLLTKSKLFCGDSTGFGDEPNTNISPVTLAHPGTLPKMNGKAIEFAIKAGLACNCEIEKNNYFARKNYFYPDLPKGYQVSQHTTPICRGGFIKIRTAEGKKKIRINRIHLEEDAGKSLHDIYPGNSAIDFNRAGVPLIEIVSEPDIRNGDEAYAYITTLRRLVRYLGICDGNMEEGSMRCDANISVRKKGETTLGTKVEVKNLNSIRNVKRAIEFEAERMIEMLENEIRIIQQTRSFDAVTGTTFSIRDKEEAEDYRYFPEPDLVPFSFTGKFINSLKLTLPALQEERVKEYCSKYQLSEYDAMVLTDEKEFSDYFEQVIIALLPQPGRVGPGAVYKSAANWMLGPVKSWLNENNEEINNFPISARKLADLIQMVEEGKLSFSVAAAKIFPALLQFPGKEPGNIAEELNLLRDSDKNSIMPIVEQVIKNYEDKVKEYRKGKKGLLSLFVGEVMKKTNGRADPKMVNELLLEKLKK